MTKRTMTRATLARKNAYLSTTATDHRVVLGPFVLRPMGEKFELYYSTRGFACTVEILDRDDATAIDAAIDGFIDEANRLAQRAA